MDQRMSNRASPGGFQGRCFTAGGGAGGRETLIGMDEGVSLPHNRLAMHGLLTTRRASMVFRSVLAAALLLASVVESADAVTNIYVDNRQGYNCSDAGPGTDPATPYCTIQQAVTDLSSGTDTIIHVVGNGLYRESVLIDLSGGSASTPFVIKATAGATIDGSDDPANESWSVHSGNVYALTGVNWTPSQVIMNTNIRLSETTTTDPANLVAYTWRYVAADQKLYANFNGGNPESGTTVNVSKRDHAFRTAFAGQDYVTIEGFYIKLTNNKGIKVEGGSSPAVGVVVKNNDIRFSGHHGIYLTNADDAQILNNWVESSHGHGIRVENGSDGALIENNVSAMNYGLSHAGISLSNSDNATLRLNNSHHNTDSGFEVASAGGSGSDNAIFYNNRSWAGSMDSTTMGLSMRSIRTMWRMPTGSQSLTAAGLILRAGQLVGSCITASRLDIRARTSTTCVWRITRRKLLILTMTSTGMQRFHPTHPTREFGGARPHTAT